jgi:hypothetical protein
MLMNRLDDKRLIHRGFVVQRCSSEYGDKDVWSWRPDAGAKSAKMLPHLAGDGGKKARFTGESTKETVKTIAQGGPGSLG